MCNRYASRQIAGRVTALVMEAVGSDDRDAMLARAKEASQITSALRLAEQRKERRGREVRRARIEARADGLMDDARGTLEWHLYDQAAWLTQRLYQRARTLTDLPRSVEAPAVPLVPDVTARASWARGEAAVDDLDAELAQAYPTALHPGDPALDLVPA